MTPLLSRYHNLDVLVRSDTAEARGINNTPPAEIVANLRRLAQGLDHVRELLGHPLEISSGYRCPMLNVAVGGSPDSQHVQGLAADFVCPGYGLPVEIVLAIAGSCPSIRFDQCILEFGRWVHISFASFALEPRRRVLTIYDSREGYLEGLYALRAGELLQLA